MTQRSRNSSQDGIALILVILVLAALVLIGTPFVLSMKLQEQSAVQSQAVHEADLASMTARNRAVARLMGTHPSRESGTVKETVDPTTSPADDAIAADPHELPAHKVDSGDELEVDARDIVLVRFDTGDEEMAEEDEVDVLEESPIAPYETSRWNGQMVDVRVEDEQGKVNINTATPVLMGNLLSLSQLSEAVDPEQTTTDIPVVDTIVFPADDDPDTVDGVVAILNPMFLTLEAISYRGKTDTHLTGCFRGDYMSIPQEHQAGWPIFDIRAFKVFLHRYYDLDSGDLKSFRTPQSIREIAEWSIVPYFLENLAVLGLNVRNMDDFGLTAEMLLRANLDKQLLVRDEEEADPEEYREAVRKLGKLGVTKGLIDMLEKFRGRAAVIEAAELVEKMDLGKMELGMAQNRIASELGKELKKIKTRTKAYFPKAIEAYKQIFDLPNMETFAARDFEQIRDLITTTSAIESEWSPEQMVIGEIQTNPILGVPSIRLERTDWYNAGTLVRIRSLDDPEKVEYQLAWVNAGGGRTFGQGDRGRGPGGLFQGGIILKAPLKHKYEEREAMVSALLRHPININSAPRRVIEACLTGLRLAGGNARAVHRAEARALTDVLLDKMPIVGFPHFRDIVEKAVTDQVIDSSSVRPILTNALNPNHPALAMSTTGFCYSTGDVYSVESTGIINDRAGVELARRHVREVIDIAPPDPLTIKLESQADWRYRMFGRQAPDRGTWNEPRVAFRLPGRNGHLMITGPIPLNRRNFEVGDQLAGSLRALTTEIPEDAFSWKEVEHFPETIEGHSLSDDGPYVMGTDEPQAQTDGGGQGGSGGPGGEPGGGGGGDGGDGGGGDAGDGGGNGTGGDPIVQDLITRPGAVEFWVRPSWENRNGERTLFDTVADPAEPDRNRIRLFFDGDTQELVFQIMDDAGLQHNVPGGASVPSNEVVGAAEIRHRVTPATFANDTWYHIMAMWGSTSPGDQALFLDHRPVGRNSWMTRLASQLQINGGKVVVEDPEIAERFPVRGTLMVGSEAIDYITRQGTTFHVRPYDPKNFQNVGRGVRGTVRQQHPQGTPVRLYGYAIDIATADWNVGLETSGNRMLMGRGGARLKDDLPISYRWSTAEGLVPFDYPMTQTGPDAVPDLAANDRTFTVPATVVPIDPLRLGFSPTGYAYIVRTVWERISGNTYRLTWQTEAVKYTAIQTGSDGNGQPGYTFVIPGRGMLGTGRLDPSSISASHNFTTYRVYGASIEVADLDDGQLLDRYPRTGIIQIDRSRIGGGNNKPDPLAPDVEWIRYAEIAEGRYFIAPRPTTNDVFRGFNGEVRFSTSDPEVNGRVFHDPASIAEHAAGQEIFPVIRLARPYAGPDDFVSIGDTEGAAADRRSEPTLMRVRKVRETGLGVYCSFYQQSVNNYFVAGMPKLKRFPSGELPSRFSGRMSFGAPADPAGGGGSFPGHIDEIRMSQIRPNNVEVTPFPTQGGRLTIDNLPPIGGFKSPTGQRKAIRPWFLQSAKAEPGGGLDKILLLGQSTLELIPTGRRWSEGIPNMYPMFKEEGLYIADNEVFHFQQEQHSGEYVDGSGRGNRVLLTQNLARDPLYADENGTELGDDAFGAEFQVDPRRDLRSEVIAQIKVSDTGSIPPRDGFLQFTNDASREVIYYERAANGVLYNCLRGQLGTEVKSYNYTYWDYSEWPGSEETRNIPMRVLPRHEIDILTRSMLNSERHGTVMVRQGLLGMPQVAVTRTTGGMSENSISVRDVNGFVRRDGYFILDDGNDRTADEIFGYVATAGTEFYLARDDRSGRGLFHGRFGTPSDRNIAPDIPLVHFQPRYHDHYDTLCESPDLNYVERSIRMPGARWSSVKWEEQEQRNRTFKNEVRVVVRFDGGPDWDEKPTNRPGGLYQFTKHDAANRLDTEAELMEIRVYFRYPPGSYGRVGASYGGLWSDDWKHSPVLDSLNIEYEKKWRVVHRENVPF